MCGYVFVFGDQVLSRRPYATIYGAPEGTRYLARTQPRRPSFGSSTLRHTPTLVSGSGKAGPTTRKMAPSPTVTTLAEPDLGSLRSFTPTPPVLATLTYSTLGVGVGGTGVGSLPAFSATGSAVRVATAPVPGVVSGVEGLILSIPLGMFTIPSATCGVTRQKRKTKNSTS